MFINYLYVGVVFEFLCLPTALRAYKILPGLQAHPNWKLLDRGEDCGFSSSYRIIGGVEASIGQYPWIARLGYIDRRDRKKHKSAQKTYECGGTIISDRYILTAAHCKATSLVLFQVRLGEHDIRTDIDCVDGVCAPPVQDIDVEKIICHRKFSVFNLKNDICLVRLAAPIQFNRFVYPACLPAYDYFQSNTFEGTIMEVAGWGVINIDTKERSNVLMTLKVSVVDHSVCVSDFKTKLKKPMTVTGSQLCAGGVIGHDSCGGDSGGPLMSAVSLDAPPRYFVVGVVSFGHEECAKHEIPGIYTNVSQYMEWILDNIRA